MTSLQFECPTTGRALPPIMMDSGHPETRIAVHCPKCSQLHTFAAADAAEEPEPALA